MSLLIPTLKQFDRLSPFPITLGIIGSRKLDPRETYPWGILAPHLTIYGFDADEDACEIANEEIQSAQIDWVEKHLPYALGKSTGEATIYITRGVHCSSLYPPDRNYVDRFLGMREGFQLESSIELPVISLDDLRKVEGIENLDFLQIDVQGADLDVLEGAIGTLQERVMAIEIEVEFSPLYQNQPLFSDIDTFLRREGFIFFDLLTDDGWCRRPRAISPIYSPARAGQLLWGNAFYFRDPLVENSHPVAREPDNIVKLACIADILDYPDYSIELLQYLTLNHGQDPRYNFAREIIATLEQFPELVERGLENLPIVASLQPFLNP